MGRRKHRSRRRSWFKRLFGREIREQGTEAISPELLRSGAGEGNIVLPGSELRSGSRRRRSFWRKLFGTRRRKKRDHGTPLIFMPKEPEIKRRKFRLNNGWFLITNSTILFLIAYILVYLLYQLSVIFTANLFNISGVLYYYDVFWPKGDYDPNWFPYFRIILITGAGPFVSLITGLIFYRILIRKARSHTLKLFFIWIALHALNMFFGAFVAGVTTNEGFGYVALWLYMNLVFRIIFSFASLFALAAFGYYATRMFYETAQSQSFLKEESRRLFLTYQVLIPAVLGSIIMILIRTPFNPPYHLLILATLFAATITAVFNRKAKTDKAKHFSKHHGRKIQWIYLIVLIGLLLFFRVVLQYGLHIIMKFSFSVSVFGLQAS